MRLIRSQPSDDLETQTLHETQFEELVRNETLTRGYARPKSLVNSADVFVRAMPVVRRRHALVVALEVDRCRVSVFILVMVLIGLAVGTGVAVIEKDLGLGAEVGGVVFGLVAVLQGTTILMYM